jgi:DNA (cytosine-5)-methyltransferase 1
MAIEHHITLEERTDTLAYASATTPPAPTMPNVKASAKKTKTFSVISLFSGCGGMDLGFKGGFDFLGKRYAKQPFRGRLRKRKIKHAKPVAAAVAA